ncbi:MAG: DUF5686 family protein [Flavobacteriales bacterium]
MKQVWKHKKENIASNFDVLSYQRYEKFQLDLNNFKEQFTDKKLMENLQFIFEYADTSELNGKTSLPVLINESIYKHFNASNPRVNKDILIANQISGFRDNVSANAVLQSADFDFDIYDPTITIFDRPFASPLASTSQINYHYYLKDTIQENGVNKFHLQYIPKRAHELTFIGDIWVDEAQWAVEKIKMRIVKDANINFISDLIVDQEFTFNEESKKWLISRDYMAMDISILNLKEEIGFFGHRTYVYSDYRFDRYWTKDQLDSLEDMGFEGPRTQKKYINTHRTEKLSESENGIYTMIDSVATTKEFKAFDKLTYVATSAYLPIGEYFELGPLWNFYSKNTIEGSRLFVGGSTAFRGWRNFRIDGHLAYGLKDEKLKYRLDYRRIVNPKNFHLLGVQIKNDVENLSQIRASKISSSSIFATLLSSSPVSNLSSSQQLTFYSFKDIGRKFKFNSQFSIIKYGELGDLKFDFLDDTGKTHIKTSELNLGLVYDYNPIYMRERSAHRKQIFAKNKYRVQLNGVFGISDLFDGDYDYQRFKLRVNGRQTVGILGRLVYQIEAERILGDVPYILLYAAPANETRINSLFSYSLLKNYEYLSDKYVSVFAEQHLEGWVFNHIPLLKKLDFREVVTFKGLYGTLDNKNKTQTIDGVLIDAPNKPGGYLEAAIGVENILRFFRVDYVFRLNRLTDESKYNQGWRLSFQFKI